MGTRIAAVEVGVVHPNIDFARFLGDRHNPLHLYKSYSSSEDMSCGQAVDPLMCL